MSAAAARALVQDQFLRLQLGESAGTDEASAVVERVLPVFRADGDEQGLCSALRLRAWHHWIRAEADAAARGLGGRRGARRRRGPRARANRDPRVDRVVAVLRARRRWRRRSTAARRSARRSEGNLQATADVLKPLAGLHAMEGRFEEARSLLVTSDAAFEELGLTLSTAVSHHAAMVELLAGDPAAAERRLRRGYAALEEMGDKALLSTTAALPRAGRCSPRAATRRRSASPT